MYHAGDIPIDRKQQLPSFDDMEVPPDADEKVAIANGHTYPDVFLELRAYAFKVTLAELQIRDADMAVKYRGQLSGAVVGRGIPESVHVIKKVRWWKVKFMEATSDGSPSEKTGLATNFWIPLMTPSKGLQMIQFGQLKSVSVCLRMIVINSWVFDDFIS